MQHFKKKGKGIGVYNAGCSQMPGRILSKVFPEKPYISGKTSISEQLFLSGSAQGREKKKS